MKFLLYDKKLIVKVDGKTPEKDCTRFADLIAEDEALNRLFGSVEARIKELIPDVIIEWED